MIALDLFAGAGGTGHGLDLAGFDVSHVERDPDACNCLRAAFPDDEILEGDLREMHFSDFAPDLLWASPPCQPFSSAGNREGASDDRDGFPWTLDAIDACSPTWSIIENVTGLRSHRGDCDGNGCSIPRMSYDEAIERDCPGCYFRGWVLPELADRFAWVDWRILDAAAFGTPQRRRRVFIVCGPSAYRWPEATHADPATLNQADMFESRKPWRTVREALGLTGRMEMIGDNSGRPDAKGVMRGPLVDGVDRPGWTVSSAPGSLRVIGGGHNPSSADDAHKRTYRDLTDTPSTTIAANAAANAGPFVVGDLLDRPAMTIQATEVKGMTITPTTGTRRRSRHQRMSDVWYDATGIRRLTVAECAALFDMPPDWPWSGTKTAQYRQVGNMVAWKVAKALADNIPQPAQRAAK